MNFIVKMSRIIYQRMYIIFIPVGHSVIVNQLLRGANDISTRTPVFPKYIVRIRPTTNQVLCPQDTHEKLVTSGNKFAKVA